MRPAAAAPLTLSLALLLLAAPALAQSAFQIAVPPGWTDVTEGLVEDQVKMVVGPDQNAFYEVYMVQTENRGLTSFTDGWVGHLRKKLGNDLSTLECSTMMTLDGRPAILRRYSGARDGIPSGSIVLVTYRGDTVWFLLGMWRTDVPSKENVVTLSVTSIDFPE